MSAKTDPYKNPPGCVCRYDHPSDPMCRWNPDPLSRLRAAYAIGHIEVVNDPDGSIAELLEAS